MTATNNQATDRAVEAFLIHEADLLDRREYDAWLSLFAEDCRYWIPLQEDQTDGHNTVSLVYDDRKLLETRIRRLAQPTMHAQAPHSRTLHVIANLVVAPEAGSTRFSVRSNQIVTEYRLNQIRIFAGQVHHVLEPSDNAFKIVSKRIDLIDSEGEHRGIPIII